MGVMVSGAHTVSCTMWCSSHLHISMFAVYKEDVLQLCERSSSGWESVIVLVPVRLGGDSLNPSYIECVKVNPGPVRNLYRAVESYL